MGVKMTTPLTTSPWAGRWELVESNSFSIVRWYIIQGHCSGKQEKRERMESYVILDYYYSE